MSFSNANLCTTAEARSVKEERQEREIARTSASYDKDGRPVSITFLEGRVERTVYDAAGRKIKLSAEDTKTGKVLEITYTYDAYGNMTAGATGKEITTYQCDPWGRATGIMAPEGVTEAYRYDHKGNITEAVDGAEYVFIRNKMFIFFKINITITSFLKNGFSV